MTTYPDPCPPWCARRHLPTWPVHTADCGDVVIGATVLAVAVTRSDSDGKPAVVALSVDSDLESHQYDLTPSEARQLLDALAEGLALLFAGAGEDQAEVAIDDGDRRRARALARSLDERFGGAR